MGVIDKIETWWESLGLSAEDAVHVETAIETQIRKSKPIKCNDCKKDYNSTDFHDCIGKYDLVRALNRDCSHTVWKRLALRYHIPTKNKAEINKAIELELSSMSPAVFAQLEEEYLRKVSLIQLADPTWIIEDELWNS